MEEMDVPLIPKWFLNSSCSVTPDNGFLYISTFHVIYVPPLVEDKAPNFRFFSVKAVALTCDPDWSETKYFAVLTETNSVLVFDIDKHDCMIGHKGHILPKNVTLPKTYPGCICFSTNKRIYSICNNIFINFCVLSNQYNIESDYLQLTKNHASALKVSPYDSSMVAIGTFSGLIIIGDMKSKKLLYRLRGHDTEIISLDWMKVELQESKKQPKESEQGATYKTSTNDLVPLHDDTSDLFDIYSFDHLEHEFGTIRDTKSVHNDSDRINKDIIENEQFNFVEACLTLKEDIIAPNLCELDDSQITIPTADEIRDDYNLDCRRSNKTVSDVSDDEASEDLSNLEFDDSILHTEKLKDFIVVNNSNILEYNSYIYLVSSSRESFLWIWDIENGSAVEKLTMKPEKIIGSHIFIVLQWINPNQIISNNTSGRLTIWNINYISNSKLKITVIDPKTPEKGIIGLSSMKNPSEDPIVWSYSIPDELQCTKLTDQNYHQIGTFTTISNTINYITDCPLDLNKVGITRWNKKFSVLNVSNIKPNKFSMITYSNKIQSRVLFLAWHPKKENILAFSTSEGQIGIYDTTKTSNVAYRLKPFTGKHIYTLAWGELVNEKSSKSMVLFAADKDGRFVYFPESGEHKYQPVQIPSIQSISAISISSSLLAAGSKSGEIHFLKLNENCQILASESISKKYISSISWNPINPNLIAVGSEPNITLIDTVQNYEKRILIGHTSVVCSVKWSNNNLNKLVSTSFDCTVRVWDSSSLTTISVYQANDRMFCAIFSPLDDNIVISGGQTTIKFLDIRKYAFNDDKSTPQKLQTTTDVVWAKEIETIIKENKSSKSRNKIKNIQSVRINEIVECLEKIQVDHGEAKEEETTTSKTMCLTNKELNRDALFAIQKLLNKDDNNESFLYHKKIFSQVTDVEEILQMELKNLKGSSSNSIGYILLPQLLSNLKEEIIERIEKKTLTEELIACSPSVSYDFWRCTCKAYAYQCVEKGLTIKAIPYLIASSEIDYGIDLLCKTNHYREAYIIAKLRKESDDPELNKIYLKWINHLNYCGNYLGMALIYLCNDDYKNAYDILENIKVRSNEIQNIMETVKGKLNAV